MLVAEGMNSRRSRRALVLCMAPMREHGAGGAFSAIFIDVVELATIEPGVRLVRAHSPNSLIGAALTPPALASAVGLRRLGRTALEGPQIARFSSSPRLAGLAPSASPRGSRASLLLAVPHAPDGLESLMRLLLLGRSGIEHRTSAAATFIACFLCLPLCACQALLLWP